MMSSFKHGCRIFYIHSSLSSSGFMHLSSPRSHLGWQGFSPRFAGKCVAMSSLTASPWLLMILGFFFFFWPFIHFANNLFKSFNTFQLRMSFKSNYRFLYMLDFYICSFLDMCIVSIFWSLWFVFSYLLIIFLSLIKSNLLTCFFFLKNFNGMLL